MIDLGVNGAVVLALGIALYLFARGADEREPSANPAVRTAAREVEDRAD
jgi:hypothetical protein